MNKEGTVVHGSFEGLIRSDVSWGPACSVAPRLTLDLKKTLTDLIRAEWKPLDIFYFHCRNQLKREGVDRDIDGTTLAPLTTLDGRDDLVSIRDLYNLTKKVMKEEVQFDENDQKSVGMWISNNKERVLVHQEYKEGPPEQDFLLALQAPWQLANMVEMSHNRPLAMDSTFAINKYGVSVLNTCFLQFCKSILGCNYVDGCHYWSPLSSEPTIWVAIVM